MRTTLLVLALIGASQAAMAQTPPTRSSGPADQARTDAALNGWTSDRLQPFENEQAFVQYLRDVRAAARAHQLYWSGSGRIQFAQAGQPDTPQPPCPADNPDCVGYPAPPSNDDGASSVIVTGSGARPQSITNNQEAGVDEGDIVKQIGRHLLVLQDGRIFVIDTRGGRGRRLTITDRANVYRDPSSDAWYDEMVVHGNRVMITGYSNQDHVSEISVFDLGANGRLTRVGTFHIRSEDYYSGENYSTRLAGDRLILYSPIELREFDPDQPISWPRLQRVGDGRRKPTGDEGRPLLDARLIYRPTLTSWNPILHAISICQLGRGVGRELGCRSTGFIASGYRQLYVSEQAAYLWTARSLAEEMDRERNAACPATQATGPAGGFAARIYRLPITGGRPGVAAGYGVPFNQLGMDASRGQFRALVSIRPDGCNAGKWLPASYFTLPDTAFAAALQPPAPAAFTAMPLLNVAMVENRFTDNWLVFGGRRDWRGWPDSDAASTPGPATVVAVPLAQPGAFRQLSVPHTVIRAERAGDNVVLTGYQGDAGLSISLVRLQDNLPKVTETILLPGRYESEGRSHAFNSLVEADGAGIMGVPTVLRADDAGRWWWRSGASDVSFANVDERGHLSRAGSLRSSRRDDEARPDFTADGEGHNGYRCEVSCVDWYGNTRPIFTDGRIFALTGTELVEGWLDGQGHMEEVQRLDLNGAVGSGAGRSDGAGGAGGNG